MKTGCGANAFIPDVETEDKSMLISVQLSGFLMNDVANNLLSIEHLQSTSFRRMPTMDSKYNTAWSLVITGNLHHL